LDSFLYVIPMIISFIIYYKVFRIASDVKEIKEMLKSSIKTETNKTQ
jgi:hypothetical protein